MCDTLDSWTYIYCVSSDERRLLDCGNYRERKEQDFQSPASASLSTLDERVIDSQRDERLCPCDTLSLLPIESETGKLAGVQN